MAVTRSGAVVRRGAIVSYYKYGGWNRGIVQRLLPPNAYSRAYGKQAEVLDAKTAAIEEIAIGDMKVLGYVKRMPKVGTVEIPPSADEMAHWQRRRDSRRAGQGASYNPDAEYNKWAETPPAPQKRSVIIRPAIKRRRSR